MDKKMFTREEIDELLKNKNVTKCSEKAISYSKAFRIEAVRLYNEEGLGSRKIFENAGFNIEIIGKDKPKGCLSRWSRISRIKGATSLETETRGRGGGGRPKKNGLTDAEKIERLEVEVAYLKAENDFLVKLRAKRRE
jgi:transposase-like protein